MKMKSFLIAGLLTSALAIQQADASVIAYWDFDNSGNVGEGTVGTDLVAVGDSVNYNAGGQFGGALDLGGDSDGLAVDGLFTAPTEQPTGNDSFSISAWIKMDPGAAGNERILTWGGQFEFPKSGCRRP